MAAFHEKRLKNGVLVRKLSRSHRIQDSHIIYFTSLSAYASAHVRHDYAHVQRCHHEA